MFFIHGLVLTIAASVVASGFFPTPVESARDVVVIDLRQASPDEKLIASTLQGLINKRNPAEIYVLAAPWDLFWLDYLKSQDFITGWTTVSLEEALRKFAPRIKTLFLYDRDLPATINIATMMASLEEGIVAASDAPPDLPGTGKRVNLDGRWKTNAEAYSWALETLFPSMNKSLLACYHPTACSHHIRDYLVQHNVFHFWVSSEEKDESASASHEEERNIAIRVFQATPANIPVLGFWYSGLDKGLDEYTGVGLAGEYGKITVVCDWATNLSFLGGVAAEVDAAISAYEQRLQSLPPPLEKDKIYICFDIVESGDSPSYVQSRMASFPAVWSVAWSRIFCSGV